MRRQALIVGGGIGGLCAAISLRLTGWDVQVFEQASQITEIGAGLQVSPNGVKNSRAHWRDGAPQFRAVRTRSD